MSTTASNLLATHANCLPIGTVIADFEIIGLVGEGGFGIVYLAKDIHLDRVVAVKEFMPSAFAGRLDGVQVAVRSPSHRATYEAGLRSFINEAKMLARFAHPALVEVYRFWESNGTAYMAMRYYAGETLRQQLANGSVGFDEQTIAQTMAPIFDALEMLHREQVFHRDIAPDNIMMSDGHPVLLDFGSARRIIGDGTQALTTVLKPGYAPIEQYVDDGTMKQGPWTDVYALGGVLYHLATGKAPCQAVSRLLSDPLLPISSVVGERFSSTFSNAVAKAMAVRVEDRLQNVRDFSESLGWNTAKPTRVMTVPSASYATHAARIDPILNLELLHPPRSAEQMAVKVGKNVSDIDKTQQELASKPPRNRLTAENPTPLPAYSARNNKMRVMVVAIGLVVVALMAYLLTRSDEPVATASPQRPTSVTNPLVQKKDQDGAVPVATPSASVASLGVSDPVAVVATGLVKLAISPWGAVVIDGVTRGISNASQLRQLELKTGTHMIEIAKPDSASLKQTIEVTADVPVVITHAFK
ncbi:MAG: serine/threonine protein kinase [Comamonadaceae bacterium]|nr:serine/threonine protein kinase [Comamonadaceae bacterium]